MGLLAKHFLTKMFCVNKNPLIVVLGATGAGKSKLGLEIAEKIGGEVINADSMQVYRGLDIVTNKVTCEEQELVPHHLINFLSPRQEYTVTQFQDDCLKTIKDIQDRGKFPVLVGGTNYYIEGVLFDLLLPTKLTLPDKADENRKKWNELPNKALYEMVKEVDPNSAQVLHPSDKRKLIRCLEVFHDTGQQMSVFKEKQRGQDGGSSTGGPLRFTNACVFWVQCDAEVLEERVYKRVGTMMGRGLLKELADFHHEYNKERLENGLPPDYEKGIFQSIGFKEFHDFLTAGPCLAEEEKLRMLKEGEERMKINTWKYAKKQIRWINGRIVNRSNTYPVYKVESTDPSVWNETVLNPALKLLKHFYKENKCIKEKLSSLNNIEVATQLFPLEKDILRNADKGRNELIPCEMCDNRMIAQHDWNSHVKSKGHKHYLKRKRKQQSKTISILEQRKIHLSEEILFPRDSPAS